MASCSISNGLWDVQCAYYVSKAGYYCTVWSLWCEAYLDDVIYSDSWQSHIQQIREVFERLSKENLMLNLAKCVFVQATVVYLGKVVDQGEVCRFQFKVVMILAFPVPGSGQD